MNTYSTYLFATLGLLGGASRTLDLSGTFDCYNISRTGEEADYLALWADWKAIGADFEDCLQERLTAIHEGQLDLFAEPKEDI